MKPRSISPSSYDKWDNCQWAYYLAYEMGIRSPSGPQAVHGTVFHSASEIGAAKTIETGEYCCPSKYLAEAQLDLKEDEKHHLTPDSLIQIQKWLTNHKLRFQEYFRLPILGIEERFYLVFNNDLQRLDDCVVPECYLNLPPSELFSINGFMDLVIKEDEETVHIVDFKTGKPKSENELRKSIQPQIYFLAASYLWPWAKHILLTFDYIKGQQRTITFDSTYNNVLLKQLRNRHLEIINCNKPKRPYKEFWLCRFCYGYNSDTCKGLWEKFNV